MEDVMTPTFGDLSDRQMLESNPLATVFNDCIVIRDSNRQSHTILSISQLVTIKRIRTSHPALLVVSSAFGLISAASFYSREGSGAAWPIALLAGAFAAAYPLSRRAAVGFVVEGTGTVETESGSLEQAEELISAVRTAQHRIFLNGE